MKKILFFVLGVAVASGLIMKPDTGHNTALQRGDKPGVIAMNQVWRTSKPSPVTDLQIGSPPTVDGNGC